MAKGAELDGGEVMPMCNGTDDGCAHERTANFEVIDDLFRRTMNKIQGRIRLPCYECIREGRVLDPDCSHKTDRST